MLQLIAVCLLIGTVQSGGYAGGPVGGAGGVGPSSAVQGGGGSFSSGPDFNPILLQGQRGYPGLRARLNSRAFQYASTLVGGILNTEIKKARIPPISQCIPMVQGCVNIYNLYVSRYRCPQRVVLYPAPPNRIVLQVQNVDLGVTGNLGGQIVVLLPIALSGIVQLNIHQATITVQLAIERGPRGPYVRLLSCDMQIGYADAYIENGGLVGDIVNSQFRSQISNQVRQMIPGQVCGQLPTIINEKINSKLGALPQTVALQQMISLFGGALGLGGGGGGTCPSTCPKQPVFIPSTNSQSSQSAPAPAALPAAPIAGGSAPAPQIPTTAYSEGARRAAAVRTLQQLQALRYPRSTIGQNITQHLVLPQGIGRQRMYAATIRAAGVGQYQAGGQGAQVATYTNIGARPKYPPPPTIAGGPVAVQPPPDCSKCSAAGGGGDDPASFLRQIAGHLDMSKLNDLYLSLQYIQSYATSNDYSIDLTGEFSPYGQGGTPFGPFPTQFPYYGGQMAEFIVTDYTVNSLFYWLHRKQFLSFRIGPETPKIGELLKTTCSDDEDDLEATEVELDEEEARRRRRLAKEKAKYRLRRGVHSNATFVMSIRPSRHVASHTSSPAIVAATNETTKLRTKRKRDSRRRRQEDTAGLADLGICFGDILPAVREKYPNQKIAVQIRTVRAPSVILSSAKGGMVTLDLIADADIYIDQTNTKVGTITIAATVVLTVRIGGGRLSGTAEITQLHLSDRTGTLGLPQDALDNLGNLGKELLQKVANDGLQKGIAISIPQNLPLPIGIINPDVHIVEHGLHIATDFTISPSLLGAGGGGC
ncbi:BPI1 domain-containing protein [Caenorhabditis elegans]|uniref:BPI1 domain-containing protein n=2 Tax=Caenorhabditis elegans TaxID=6239 RepID=H9G2Z8_CAEEL|nr:BPI1 domain-containing protein [Caenorhabditis elegans]CCG28161.1 BPI1 domain-containing protein [Caenorhabditis elegans]|eukprot:NP_001250777.1 Uncharacterized protein CELE_F10D11.6 [Caenorhabditis elegans]